MSNIQRRAGYWHEEDLQRFTAMVGAVAGEFAEIGVWQGAASRKLVKLSAAQTKRTHLLDSFQGMDDFGPFDSGGHPKGEFDVGGVAGFRSIMRANGCRDEEYSTWAGFIPACFSQVPDALRLSFAIVDVDNYVPTGAALDWVWPRLNRGGVLALDDFYPAGGLDATKSLKEFLQPTGGDVDSTRAIKEFLIARSDYSFIDYFNHQLFLRRIDG